MGFPDTKQFHSIAIISMAGQLCSLGLAFLFHFAMGRMLGVSLYGDLGVLIGIYTVLMVPAASIQAILAREAARLSTEGKEAESAWMVRKYFMRSVLLGVPLAVVLWLGMQLFGLGVEPAAAAFILLSVPLFYSALMLNAWFQGKRMPFHYSGVVVAMDSLRLVLSLALVFSGYALAGIGIAYLLDALIVFVPCFLFMRSRPQKSFPFTLKADLPYVFPANVVFSLFLVTDLFFVRYFLGATDAGLYNAASVLSRLVFYANVGLMAAFLPHSSTLDAKRDSAKIRRTALISLGLLAAIAIGLFLFRDFFLGVLYGKDYLAASPILAVLSGSIFLLAAGVLLVNLMWSQREQAMPLLASCGAYVLFLALLWILVPVHGIMGAAYASLASTACLLALCGIAVWKRKML